MEKISTLWANAYNLPLAEIGAAVGRCTVNGREVPCGEFGKAFSIFAGFGIAFFLVVLALFIASLVFWFMMLVDAIKRDIELKPLWILVILLTGVIGALVYYFAVKRSAKKVIGAV